MTTKFNPKDTLEYRVLSKPINLGTTSADPINIKEPPKEGNHLVAAPMVGRAMALKVLDDLLSNEEVLNRLREDWLSKLTRNPTAFFNKVVRPLLSRYHIEGTTPPTTNDEVTVEEKAKIIMSAISGMDASVPSSPQGTAEENTVIVGEGEGSGK